MLNLDETVLYGFSRASWDGFKWISVKLSDSSKQTIYTLPVQDSSYNDIVFLPDKTNMLIADHH
jgi:hypothetical protein